MRPSSCARGARRSPEQRVTRRCRLPLVVDHVQGGFPGYAVVRKTAAAFKLLSSEDKQLLAERGPRSVGEHPLGIIDCGRGLDLRYHGFGLDCLLGQRRV